MRSLLGFGTLLALVVSVGCSETTTRKDVANARDKLQNEQQQTAETIREGQNNIADAQRNAEHTVAKPVTPEPTADQQKIADAQQDAVEKVAKQKEQERAAAANLADKEQQFQATQARDAYIKEVENKLADTDKQVDALKQQASNAQDAQKDAINRQIETMKTQRDLAQKALNDLKGADLASWKNHQEHVRLALQDLDKSTRTVR